MRAKLFCKTGPLAGTEVDLTTGAAIGKAPGNDLRLSPPTISGQHARISLDETTGGYVLEDLGSSNGTQLDGMPVHEKEPLGRLHVITFANTFDFIFQLVSGDAPAAAAPAPQASAPAQPAPAAERPADGTMIESDAVAMPSLGGDEGDNANRTMMDTDDIAMPSLGESGADSPDRTMMEADDFAMPSLGGAAEESSADKTMMEADDFVTPKLGGAAADGTAEISMDRTLMDADDFATPSLGSPAPSTAPVSYMLSCRTEDGAETIWMLKPGDNVVGRSRTCDIALDDRSLSRRHAQITLSETGVTVRDLGSVNGTFVDGAGIADPTSITDNTTLKFGTVTAKLVPRTEG